MGIGQGQESARFILSLGLLKETMKMVIDDVQPTSTCQSAPAAEAASWRSGSASANAWADGEVGQRATVRCRRPTCVAENARHVCYAEAK